MGYCMCKQGKQQVIHFQMNKECYLQNVMQQCQILSKNEKKESETLLHNKIDQIFNVLSENIKESMAEYSNQLIVKFMELTCEVTSKRSYSELITSFYFQRFKHPNQFYIRALLVRARLIAQQGHIDNKKGEEMVLVLKEALSYTTKALDIITGGAGDVKGKDPKGNQDNSKQKYAFLIYNVSTCIYKIIRFMLKSNWQKSFTDIVERICKLFDQIDEPDHNWRCRFNLILHQCLYDSDKKPDSFKVLDQLWEKTKTKSCDFQDELFKLRVHLSKENGALAGSIKKDLEGAGDAKGWKILEVLQRMRSGLIPQPQIEKQLMNAVNSISSAVLIGNQSSANKLSPLIQDRLAETGRVALLYNHINIADSITNFLNKVRQLSQKAMVLNQYNKAELLIQKKGSEIDNKTGMKLNAQQLKAQEIERRSEALKILQKVSLINKRQGDAELIYEGCILIWNICLPLMTLSQRQIFTKSMQAASELLEQIDSNDHSLRVKLHLELAKTYFSSESTFSKVEEHILKAMDLDYTIPINKITHKYNPEEDLSLYQRPYDRYIQAICQKSELKKHHQQRINTDLDKIVIDLWNVMGQKSENTKIDILQKSLGSLVGIEPKQYDYENAQQRSLVEEEIKQELVIHKQNNLKILKKKKLLAAEIAELAFEWEINQLAESACEIVIQDKWEPENALEMILSQVKCYYFLGQLHIDYMIKDNLEVAFADPVRIDDEDKKEELGESEREHIIKRKQKIFKSFSRGIELADSIKQSWLIFNGAIYIWNNFLHIFKNPINDSKLLPDLSQLLKQLFQTMKNNLKDGNKKIVSYDSDRKGQIFANIGLIYARQMENMKQPDEVNRICEALSLTQLSPHTRKLINSIKSRVTAGKGGNPVASKQAAGKGKEIVNSGESGNDVFLFEIVSQIEIIKNSVNKGQTGGLIKKCFQNLQNWKPRENDETDLELHAELWTRLARLALNEDNIQMFKYAIRCVENSLLPSLKTEIQISPNRLRWYSLAEYTYGQSLFKMINPQTQDVETCQKLLFEALNHTSEAVEKGFRCSLNILVLDGAKQVWNLCSKLQESAINRKNLIKPIYHSLTCLKLLKEKSETDLLLLLSQLLFKAALENKEYKIGETTADMLFELVPKNMQKSLWEAKMIFMSKQGKNQLQAISNIKEADVSLQAKLWVKLARASTIINKQHAAYNKAIQILRKEGSVEIVEVLIEYAEWQLRVNKENRESILGNLLLASDYLIDIEYGEDEVEQNLEDDKATIFSRSSRGRRSQASNQQSFKSKQTNTKKQLQKKAVISNKSKGSRMNRTARAANTVKSKNTKSIFVQREEEANPESLNCAHYERLFRIHTLLALISKTTEQRIRYALDAKHFLIKILEVSFRTLNIMDENAAKYSNAMEEKKTSTQEYVKKYKIPVEIQDWVRLVLPKQFMEKVKTLEDYNFMGIYMFQKPELTFSYIEQLLGIFQRYGYLLHTIPIFFFTKFISKQIINNNWLSQVCDMRLAKILKKCGFNKELYQPLEITRVKLTEAEKKLILSKTNSLKYQPNESTSLDTLYEVPNQIPLPNLVKPFSERQYEVWANLAHQLLEIGSVSNSKELFKESLIHCKILKDIKTMDRCFLGLTKIALIQGEMVEASNLVAVSNKMCRDVKQWQIVYETMFQVLISAHKFEELRKFSRSILDVISKLVEDIKRNKKSENITHEHEHLELQHFLTSVTLLNVELAIEEYMCSKKDNGGTVVLEAINSVYGEIINESTALLLSQYDSVCKTFSTILVGLEEGLIEPHNPQFGISVNNKLMSILLKFQTQIMNSGRYSLIGISEQCFKTYNPMVKLQHRMRLCIARSYNVEGLLKKAGGAEEVRRKMERMSLLRQESTKGDQEGEKKEEAPKTFEPLKKYLETLTIKIQKEMAPIQKRLDSHEASISLLRNLESKIAEGIPLEIELGMLLMSVERRRAALKQELKEVWAEVPNEDDHLDKFDANESLQRSEDFIQRYQNRCGDILKQPKAFSISRRVYIEMIENRGRIFPDKTFQYLAKYQHYGYVQKLKKCANLWLEDNSSFISYQRLLRKMPVPDKSLIDQINRIPLFQSLTKFPSYSESLDLIPNNSALIILSLSLNKNEMYFGMYSKVNSLELGKEPSVVYNVRKMELTPKLKTEILQLEKQFSTIKATLAKIPINEEEKYSYLVEELEIKSSKALERFQGLQQWWSEEVSVFLNTPRQEPNVVVDPKDAKKGAKEAPKNAKKGGKDELSAYQSTLTPSPSGVESLTFLIDTELYSFPFESLSCFSNVPSLSRDTSISFLSRKLQYLNYKPQLNNSDNFGIDKAKYICYDYKIPEQNGESIFLEVPKVAPSIKLEGISTNKRLPSLGEYQQIFSSSNILHIYGSLSFVNTLKFSSLVSNIGTSKLRLILINDNINSHKESLNKFYPIEQGETHPIEEEDIDMVNIMNLMNISVVKTRWSVNVNENKSMIRYLYKEGGSNIYLAAALKKVMAGMESQLSKIGMFINGPAVIRL